MLHLTYERLHLDFKGRYLRFEMVTELEQLESHQIRLQIGLIPADEIPEEKTIGLMRKSFKF